MSALPSMPKFAPNWAAIANIVGGGLIGAGSPGGWANFGPSAMQAGQAWQQNQQNQERFRLLKEQADRERQRFEEDQRTSNQERARKEQEDAQWRRLLGLEDAPMIGQTASGASMQDAGDRQASSMGGRAGTRPAGSQDPRALREFTYGDYPGSPSSTGSSDPFANLTPTQRAYLAAAGRETGMGVLGGMLFKEQGQPHSALAKLKADLDAGRIDRPTYDAMVKKETAMPQGPAPTETERLLRLAGIDPSSPEGQSIIKGKLSGSAGIQVDTNNDGVPDITVGGSGIGGKPTESNSQALFRGTLLGQAMDEIQAIAESGFANISPGRMAASEFAGQYGPLGRFAGEKIKSDEEKKYQAAIGKATESLVAAITGAGVAVEQFPRIQQNIPLPTDNPDMVRYKLQQLQNELRALKLSAGPLAPAMTQGQGAGGEPTPPITEGTVIVNPQTKERLILKGGQWVPAP